MSYKVRSVLSPHVDGEGNGVMIELLLTQLSTKLQLKLKLQVGKSRTFIPLAKPQAK